MNLTEIKQSVFDLRNELNVQFKKYLELASKTYELDFSEVWTDNVREDRAELFEEHMREEVDELCRKNDAFVEDSKHVTLEATDFLHIATDNLTYGDDMTLEEFVREEVVTVYPDSVLIDHIYKDDEFISELIESLEFDGFSGADMQAELDQLREFVDLVKKTVIQLSTINEELAEINSTMRASFSEFCESYEELRWRYV